MVYQFVRTPGSFKRPHSPIPPLTKNVNATATATNKSKSIRNNHFSLLRKLDCWQTLKKMYSIVGSMQSTIKFSLPNSTSKFLLIQLPISDNCFSKAFKAHGKDIWSMCAKFRGSWTTFHIVGRLRWRQSNKLFSQPTLLVTIRFKGFAVGNQEKEVLNLKILRKLWMKMFFKPIYKPSKDYEKRRI